MITEAIIGVLAGLLTFVIGLFPEVERPDWLDSVVTTIADGLQSASHYGQWIPLGAVGGSIAFVLACFAAAFAIRVVRMALSLFTGGGGSAA